MGGKKRDTDELRDFEKDNVPISDRTSNEGIPPLKRLRRSVDGLFREMKSKENTPSSMKARRSLDGLGTEMEIKESTPSSKGSHQSINSKGNREKQTKAELAEIAHLRKVLGVERLDVEKLVDELTVLENENDSLEKQIGNIIGLTYYK